MTRVKICGIKTVEMAEAASKAGAAYIGLVHYEKSPRHMDVSATAALAAEIPFGICKTALLVNPDNAFLDMYLEQVPIDMIQLHGAETPERVAEVKARSGLPVMKAVGISGADDLAKIDAYAVVADQLLVDAKPPKDANLPGGNGLSFDWQLIAGRRWSVPWMLAGGLTPENASEAVKLTGATQLDVSSGVESAPGVKDTDMIKAFVEAAKA